MWSVHMSHMLTQIVHSCGHRVSTHVDIESPHMWTLSAQMVALDV